MKSFLAIITFALAISTSFAFTSSGKGFLSNTPSQVDMLNKRFPIRLEGHRGAGDLEPENTIQAFNRAIEIGLDGVEIDIWLTEDKVPVVVHGLPGGLIQFMEKKMNISKINYEALELMPLKNGQKIVSLAHVLDVCKDKITLNIEFKDPNEEIVGITLSLIQEKNMLHQVTFSSFHHSLRNTLTEEVIQRNIRTPLNFGFLFHVFQPKFPAYEDTLPGDALNIDIRYLRQNRERCIEEMVRAKENSLEIKIWFPLMYVEKNMHYDEFMRLGVDAVITNYPYTAMGYFNS